jgi:hypothetical protein
VPGGWTAGWKRGTSSARASRGLAVAIAQAMRCQRCPPAPPPAGAGLCWPRTCGSVGDRPARAGKRGSRFLIPPGGAKALSPPQWQGPSPLPQRCAGIRTGRGPKAPGQRPPRPWRALPARRVGRWPLFVPDLRVCRAPSRAGGGNAGRVSCPRPNRRKHCQRCNGRGQRPCHSVTLPLARPGAQSPRPAPAPPPAGAGLRYSRTCRSACCRSARAGETRCVS